MGGQSRPPLRKRRFLDGAPRGRLRAPPVADAASKKEWPRSKFEAAVSAAHKFRAPQQTSRPTGAVRFIGAVFRAVREAGPYGCGGFG